MEKPSFKSSPWIRGAPHRVFSRDIRRTRWRISLDTGGRPGFLRRDFHVQKSLNPLRCQPMTVSGLTITRAWRQPGHRQDRMTQKTLSAFRSDGRGLFRFRTATCCRRARISVWSAARSAKISMILCMPERVSGGDAKFQGFCDRWNKWEGQGLTTGKSALDCNGFGTSSSRPRYRLINMNTRMGRLAIGCEWFADSQRLAGNSGTLQQSCLQIQMPEDSGRPRD